MKMAKRVLAIVVSVLMIVGTCVVAASAAETLQAQINGGATTVTLTRNTKESITVNGNVTINLAGYRLTSADGQAAITVTGGNVTITDGQVISMFGNNVPTAKMIETVKSQSPSAIVATGGNVTLDGVRVVGGMTRIPTTSPSDAYTLPTGSALELTGGATATLKRSSLYGRYGVNNKVSGGSVGGAVTIEDAIILGFMKAVKGSEIVPAGTEKVNAADRIAGVLNSNITMEDREINLMKKVLGERAMIYTQTADALIEKLELDAPQITVTEGVDLAEVTASEIDYTWPNTKGTDCSYKLVPEAVVLSNGSLAALDAVDANLVEGAQIKYRIEFKVGDEAKPFVEDYENYIDLNWWARQADELYASLVSNSTKAVDSYNEVLSSLGDVLYTLDSLGSTPLLGEARVDDVPEFNTLRQKIVEIGGAAAYNICKDREYAFSADTYAYYFGSDAVIPADGIYGTLDRVAKLKAELDSYLPFTNTANWGDIAKWAYDNYEEVIDIMDTLVAQMTALQQLLKGDKYQAILGMSESLSSKVELIDWVVEKATYVSGKVHSLLNNSTVKKGIAKVEANKGELKTYVNKAVYAIENYRTYVNPDKFIDGDFVKTYATYYPAEIVNVEGDKKLDLYIYGQGTINYSMTNAQETVVSGTADNDFQSYGFVDGFTLTAVPDAEGDYEFLYWVNEETNRILSTEETLTISTNIDRAISAYFQPKNYPRYTFVNTTGTICGFSETLDNNGNIEFSDVENPSLVGFSFNGWTGASNSLILATAISAADKGAYYSGSASAFADPNAYYGPEGAILSVHAQSSSLLILPTYASLETDDNMFTVYFKDGSTTYKTVGPMNNIATVTASGEGFSYWADETGRPVNLHAEYTHSIVRNATFTAVYNAANVPTDVANVTALIEGEDKATFIIERSTNSSFNSTGAVLSFTNPMPTIGGEGVLKGTAKYTTADGIYTLNVKYSSMTTGKVYVRPYIEIAGQGVIYGDVFEYPVA